MPRFKATPKCFRQPIEEERSGSEVDAVSETENPLPSEVGEEALPRAKDANVAYQKSFVPLPSAPQTELDLGHTVGKRKRSQLDIDSFFEAKYLHHDNRVSSADKRVRSRARLSKGPRPLPPDSYAHLPMTVRRRSAKLVSVALLAPLLESEKPVRLPSPDQSAAMASPEGSQTELKQDTDSGPDLEDSTEGDQSASSQPRRYFLPERVPVCRSRDRDKEIIKCNVCGKRMRRGSLREHVDRHENSGRFECNECGKNFSRASARDKHLRTHTGERPYICSLCPKAYRQKVHLNEHMRSHTGERPYVCRLCGLSLTSKSLLNRHLRTHGILSSANEVPEMWLRTDASKQEVLAAAAEVGRSLTDVPETEDRPESVVTTALNGVATVAAIGRKHLCPVCPAGFPTIQALRSHRSTTHGIVAPHRCPSCTKSFTSLKLMKIHLRKGHPLVCPLCGARMAQRCRWLLEVHIRDKHQGICADLVLGPSPLITKRVHHELAERPIKRPILQPFDVEEEAMISEESNDSLMERLQKQEPKDDGADTEHADDTSLPPSPPAVSPTADLGSQLDEAEPAKEPEAESNVTSIANHALPSGGIAVKPEPEPMIIKQEAL